MPRGPWARITLNLTPAKAADAKTRAKALGFASFAAYIAQLIDDDLRARRWILRNEGETMLVDPPAAATPSATYQQSRAGPRVPPPRSRENSA